MVLGMAGVVLLATIQLAGIGGPPQQVTNWSAEGTGIPFTVRCKLAFGAYYTRYISAPPAQPPPGKEICSTGSYEFAYSASVHAQAGPHSWQEVARLPCKYINLGADGDRHGHSPNYFNYVAVQGSSKTDGWGCRLDSATGLEDCGEWCVCHDLRTPIPLPDGSVDRIHSEDPNLAHCIMMHTE